VSKRRYHSAASINDSDSDLNGFSKTPPEVPSAILISSSIVRPSGDGDDILFPDFSIAQAMRLLTINLGYCGGNGFRVGGEKVDNAIDDGGTPGICTLSLVGILCGRLDLRISTKSQQSCAIVHTDC